jgi:hypothetical protein
VLPHGPLPQQLQDVLLLAFALQSNPADPRPGGGGQPHELQQLVKLLELPAAEQLSTQSVQTLVDVALKVCVLCLQLEPGLGCLHWHLM